MFQYLENKKKLNLDKKKKKIITIKKTTKGKTKGLSSKKLKDQNKTKQTTQKTSPNHAFLTA